MDRKAADLGEPRKRAIAAAIRRAYGRLGASVCTAYLLTDDRQKLVAAMTVDTPLSFAIPACFDVDDMTWPITRCLRTGNAMVFGESETQEGFARHPAYLDTTYLVPMSLAAAPIRTGDHLYGAMGLRWIPPRKISARDRELLQEVADGLAAELEGLEAGGITASMEPVFIPSRSEAPTGDPALDARLLREAVETAAARSSFLHQLQNLMTELTCAVRTEDILEIAQDRIVRPYGGTGLAVCLVEGDRLHVVGAAGTPREVVRHLEGTPLSRHTPETDTVNHSQARIFPSLDALQQEYPDIDVEVERPPIGYFPVIRSGRTAGCCVFEFAGTGEPPPSPAEATLMATMLEKVGQTLIRARSQEVEHTLSRSIQRSLLPRSLPHVPEVAATARYFAATKGVEVGGDWYDVLTLPDGGIGLVIGDVEGHTLEAAAVMGQMRSAVRAYAAEGHEPAEVLSRSNRLLMGLDTDLRSTCCCVWLNVADGVALVASGGHPAPLVGNGHGKAAQPSLPIGPPLGVTAQAGYHQRAFELQRGSMIALFTDGLLDARAPEGEAALRRLARPLADGGDEDLEVLADRLVGDSHPQHDFDDDAALVVARYEGGRPGDAPRVARMSVRRDDLGGVTEVRHFLDGLLQRWELVPLLDDVQVMASEVVTNALIHAHSAVDLRLREYPNRIRVEVQDSDPNPPVPTTLLEDEAGNEEAEAGRGLLIVDALAQAWGSSPAGRGKVTWFEIANPVADARSRTPARAGTA